MTARPHFRITCNALGCEQAEMRPGLNPGDARRALREEGWVSKRPGSGNAARDYCPIHAPDYRMLPRRVP